LFLSKRPELHCRHCRINDDETAAANAAGLSCVSAGTCLERDGLLHKTSGRAHDCLALFVVGVFGWSYTVQMPGIPTVAHFWGTPFALGFGAIICLVGAIITRAVIARRDAATAT
jgi:hypothetical protein